MEQHKYVILKANKVPPIPGTDLAGPASWGLSLDLKDTARVLGDIHESLAVERDAFLVGTREWMGRQSLPEIT